MNTNNYDRHDANVYKTADGKYEVICQTKRCNFRLAPADMPTNDYAHASEEAKRHSQYRFR